VSVVKRVVSITTPGFSTCTHPHLMPSLAVHFQRRHSILALGRCQHSVQFCKHTPLVPIIMPSAPVSCAKFTPLYRGAWRAQQRCTACHYRDGDSIWLIFQQAQLTIKKVVTVVAVTILKQSLRHSMQTLLVGDSEARLTTASAAA
jgi:hypothetical protein